MNSSTCTGNDLHTSQLNEVVYKYLDFRGKTPLKIGMDWGGGDILALSANNVVMGGINKDKEAYFGSESLYSKWMNKGVCERGDILLTMEAPLGNVAQIPDDKKYILSQRVILVKLRKDIVSPDFIFHLFMGDEFQRDLIRHSTGSTVTGIQQKKLHNINISYPSLIKQKKIAKILTTIDQLIEKTQTLIDKHTIIKQGMMTDLFTRGIDLTIGQLRPPVEQAQHLYKETKLGWIPKEWDIKSIEHAGVDLVDGDRGANYPSSDDFLKEGYCVFLSATNVTKKGFDWDKLQFISKEKHNKLGTGIVQKYDIVITTRGTVGNIAYFANDLPYSAIRINSGMLILRNNNSQLNSEYLYNLYTEYLFNIEFRKVVSGSAQPQLPAKDLKRFLVFIPSIDEQEIVNTRVMIVSRSIKKENERLAKLIKTKAGLMQDLLTGKVSV